MPLSTLRHIEKEEVISEEEKEGSRSVPVHPTDTHKARMNVKMECIRWSMEQLATGQTDFSRQLTDTTGQLTALLDSQDDLQSDVTDRREDMSVKLVAVKEVPVDHHRNPDYPSSISRIETSDRGLLSALVNIRDGCRNTRSLRRFSGEVQTLRRSQGAMELSSRTKNATSTFLVPPVVTITSESQPTAVYLIGRFTSTDQQSFDLWVHLKQAVQRLTWSPGARA